jgi:hypothetical protein
MTVSPHRVTFTLADEQAAGLSRREPDAIPAYRQLRQVLRLPADDRN